MSYAEKRRAELRTQQEKQRDKLEHELSVIEKLPDDMPEPRSMHIHTLYGSQVGLTYGSDGRFMYGTDAEQEAKRPRSIAEALELFDSLGGKLVSRYTVKDGCLAIKPFDKITDDEHERSIITGPYLYELTKDQHSGNQLEAWIRFDTGITARVTVNIANEIDFGGWCRVQGVGDERYPESLKWGRRWANLGEDRTVAYATSSYTGDGSRGRLVYLFATTAQVANLIPDAESDDNEKR
jgi:hypothetical protein